MNNLNNASHSEFPGNDGHTKMGVTWTRAAKIWWSIVWRGVLFGALAGGAAGFVTGILGASVGARPETLSSFGSLVGVLAAVPVGIWVVKTVLQKSWSDFEIVLARRQNVA